MPWRTRRPAERSIWSCQAIHVLLLKVFEALGGARQPETQAVKEAPPALCTRGVSQGGYTSGGSAN